MNPPQSLFVDTGMFDLQIFQEWSPCCLVKNILLHIQEMLFKPQIMMNYYSSQIQREASTSVAIQSTSNQPAEALVLPGEKKIDFSHLEIFNS